MAIKLSNEKLTNAVQLYTLPLYQVPIEDRLKDIEFLRRYYLTALFKKSTVNQR